MTVEFPLSGVRVLTLENFIAGPVASMWLADAGAEVVKVERPGVGDSSRSMAPFRDIDGGVRSLSFLRANRNKSSLTLDVHDPRGRDIFLSLVREADVVLENLNPTAMLRLGLDYESLAKISPRLVYVSISGFGRNDVLPSPLSNLSASDIVGQAMSGLMYRPENAGNSPVYLGFPLADLYAATLAVAGTYQALFVRERSGSGSHVDISMVDGMIALNELAITMFSATNEVPKSGLHALAAPFGVFRALDGDVVIGVLGEAVWKRFTNAMGMPALAHRPEFGDGVSRSRNQSALFALMQPWLSTHSVAEIVKILSDHGVPVSPVLNVQGVVTSEHAIARRMFNEIDDEAWGQLITVGNPIKSSSGPEVEFKPAPNLGEDTDRILHTWLGLSDDDIAALHSVGVA